MYTYKYEVRDLSRWFGPPPVEINAYVIRNSEETVYGCAPPDWTEDDVKAAVAHLNADLAAELALRAKLGEEGYARYLNDIEA